MTWWAWLIVGAVLFGAELVAIDAQFYLVFLGLSAAMVGLLGLVGISLPVWAQLIVFAALSLVSMFTFRNQLYARWRGNPPGFQDGVAGDFVVIESGLAAGQSGRVQFRGSDWTVVNDGSVPIAPGARVPIRRSEGLTLYVNSATDA